MATLHSIVPSNTIPGSTHLYHHQYVNVLLLPLLISFLIMEPVDAFNYSDRVLTCKELSCANNNVCYTVTENGTQDGHAYCQCQGEWAGLRCQSKLSVTKSSASTTSVTLRIRGMTSSKPAKTVPMKKLYVTDFSVSFWNLNGSSAGCNILRLKTLFPRVTIKGLDNGQDYMVCVANGATDLCRLKSSNSSKTSKRSNCLRITTSLYEDEPFDLIRFVIVPIIIVIFIAIIIAILVIKRKSMFVQFILYFFCCRKCYCCRKRAMRKKQHLMRKQRNTSGNFLLPSDPDQPFDDSMSFGARSFPSNLALSGAGNRSSMISDSFRSGFTPDSDEKFPSFLEENPNPLFNPNVLSGLDFQSTSELDNHHQPIANSSVAFVSVPNDNGYNLSSLPIRQNSSPSTFLTSDDYNTQQYFLNRNSQPNTTQGLNMGNNSCYDTLGNCSNEFTAATTRDDTSTISPQQNTTFHQNSILSNHFPPIQSHQTQIQSPTSTLPPPFYSTIHTPQATKPNSQTLPNGKPQLFRRHFSTPEAPDGGKSPPGAVRVFPHEDEWTRHLQRMYSYNNTPAQLSGLTKPNTFSSGMDNMRNSQRRKRRPIMKRRPLSYDFDYHKRYDTDTYNYLENMKNFFGISTPITSSQDAYAVATLPRRLHNQSIPTNTSPRHHPNPNNHRHRFTRSNSTSDSFYSMSSLPRDKYTLPHHLNLFSTTALTEDRLQNGDVSFSHSKEDAQSMTSSSYTESSISKDSSNSNDPPFRKKRVKSLIGQFERTLPQFLRQNSRRKSTTFCDEEYFRDLASPLAVERRSRRSSTSKKKNRPLSQPTMFEFSGNTSELIKGVDLDPIFQGHPSQHALPPLKTEEEECYESCTTVLENGDCDPPTTLGKTSLSTSHKVAEDTYVISAFDEDSTNLVTPFILKKSSSDESVDKCDVMSTLADGYV